MNCREPRCNNKIYVNGYCYTHYYRYRVTDKICSVIKCFKPCHAKGLCCYHYSKTINPYISKIKHYQFCTQENCNKKHYARGLCRKHYANKIYNRKEKYKCIAPNCITNLYIPGSYCCRHKARHIKGQSLDLNIKIGTKGKINGNWKGGIAQYQNHYEMKKIRKIILEKENYKCESCGKVATEIHHKDKTKTNHNIDNLLALCRKCHLGIYHRGEQRRPKMFGNIGLVELSKQMQISASTLSNFLRGKKTSNRILEIIKKFPTIYVDNYITL